MTDPRVYIDVPCEACGYNLRGLSGQWVRCPECGQQRSWESIESLRRERESNAESQRLAAESRTQEARITRAETGANLCAIAVGGFMLAGLLRLVARDFFDGIVWPIVIVSLSIGLAGAVVYEWNCGAYPRRWSAFLRHQKFAVATVLLNMATIAAVFWLTFAFLADAEGPPACLLLVALAAPFLIWIVKPFAVLSRRARREIETLLRRPND